MFIRRRLSEVAHMIRTQAERMENFLKIGDVLVHKLCCLYYSIPPSIDNALPQCSTEMSNQQMMPKNLCASELKKYHKYQK